MAEPTSKSESTEPKREPREPRALSNEYHKARKQLMLWSAILFIWELVGIDLEKAKEAGGNAGAIIGALKSPQAVPWALLVLVAYFAFKLRIEWGQCNLTRRQMRESRMDYYSAFAIAFAGCALYFGQAISNVQFANAFQGSSKPDSVLSGMFFVALVGILVGTFLEWRSGNRSLKYHAVRTGVLLAVLASLLVTWVESGGINRWSGVGVLIALIMTGIAYLLHVYRHRKDCFG